MADEQEPSTLLIEDPSRAGRLLELLSSCNKELLRVTDETELWQRLCHLVVDMGGYRMCWAGTVEDDERKTVRPVAHAGFDDGYLDTVHITWRDDERGRGPTGTAAREGTPQVCRNLLTDPAFSPWREDATRRGYGSSIALPLVVEGRTLGVLNLYASAPDRFDAEEVRLLAVVADDLALGLASVRDRVDRMRAETQLAASQDLYRSLVETTAAVAWEVDVASQRFTYISPQIETLSGYSPEEWVDLGFWAEKIHPDDRARAVSYCKAQTEAGADHAFDYRLVTAAGEVVWWRDVVSVIRAEGRPVALRGHFLDVTEHKEAEADAMRFSRALESSLTEIYTFDAETLRFVHVNFGARENLGYSMKELRALTPLDIKPGLTPERFAELIEPLRAGREDTIEFDIEHQRKDGTRYPVEVFLQLMEWGTPVFLANIRDITGRVKLEREKQQLEAQYRQAQKMEAIGRLAGGVAHDFNNMLCAITGNVTLALRELSAGHSVAECLKEIAAASDRATELTRQLLAFSRKQVIAPKVIDLSGLIGGMHAMLSRLIGDHIVLRTVPQRQLGRVRADPGQVEQILLNLAINARDAMPDGGELVIETADVVLDEDYCAKHARTTPGEYVMLGVSDTGVGMTAEVRNKIFEPFFTTKELGRGTGLGLATVFGIVQQSGGRVEVYSEPGHGSSFKVYLPRVHDELEAEASPSSTEVARGQETVLLVEDEEMVRSVAMRILELSGYRVLPAGSGGEAVTVADGHDGPIELLLTDVVMPGMNGRQLAAELRARRPEIKVLYASGYTENVIAHHGVIDEHVEFVAKPYSVDGLTARVREVLDKS